MSPLELICKLSSLPGLLFGAGCYEILGAKDGAKPYRKEGNSCFGEFAANPGDTADRGGQSLQDCRGFLKTLEIASHPALMARAIYSDESAERPSVAHFMRTTVT